MNLALCSLLALAALAPAPEIAGTIVDSSAKTVAGVAVSVVAIPSDRIVATTISGSGGTFHFTGVVPGAYGVTANTKAACAFSDAIRVDAGFTSVVYLRLVKGLCQNPIGFAQPFGQGVYDF